MKLKTVIVGAKSKTSREQVLNALDNLCKNIEIFKARPAFKSFEIVKNKDGSLWK